ncbi:hypothetical protein TWF102_004951 [Orbilia oligospora]|uniref:F-box domain-containing protein n=1 Tax=Orbilia oligospora TaxID=2813651 RepID=A0A7C8JD02_ORBOL|nr:hypothetical protein TWF102_004951 [Orbilia oligospora]
MTSLSNLIPELLDPILFYLRKRDILSLLRTCKYLHSVCLPYRWSRLTLYDTTTPNYDDFSIYNEPSKRRVWRLADTTDEFGVDALGYKYIKKIKILAPQTTFSIESRTVKNGFQRLLGDLTESGKINLREVALRDDNRHPIPPDVDFKDNIIDEIEALTQLLSGAVNLRELCIQPESLRYEPGSIHSLAEPLKDLQTALDGLKRLQKLVIGSVTYSSDSAVFFHPSFFIAPPENCKTLQYGCTASIAWWRKFAAHPLPGVENLRLSLSPMTLISSQWIDDNEDEEALQQITPGEPINIQYQATDPIDLEACIYRRNKGLNEAHRKRIKDEVISGFHRQVLDGFSVGMARCARRIATRHFEDWMGRNAIEEASAERCFEELNLEKEKHVVEFTKLLSSWAERNIDKFHFYSIKNQDEFKLLEGFIEDDV